MMHKNPRGFTIVELLVVITVVGILAAISITAYASIQSRAKDALIRADMRNVAAVLEQYRAREGTLPQSATVLGDVLSTDAGPYTKIWLAQNTKPITSASDYSGKIYKATPNATGDVPYINFNFYVAIERSTDTYCIFANSSFDGVYFMNKDKKISVGTVEWSTDQVTLMKTNGGMVSPISYAGKAF